MYMGADFNSQSYKEAKPGKHREIYILWDGHTSSEHLESSDGESPTILVHVEHTLFMVCLTHHPPTQVTL